MKHAALVMSIAGVFLAGTPALATDAVKASASFVDAHGQANGTAELTEVNGGGVLLSLEVSGLPASQWVAVHIHETGSCDHASGHASAGGHFNPAGAEHGFASAKGPHAGDMPNQHVDGEGVLRAQIHNAAVSLDGEGNGLRGRAIMIHAGADDYVSQPAGDAGARIACAVIE